MGIITDNLPKKKREGEVQAPKSFKDAKRFISEQFYQALNKHTVDEKGNYVTKIQKIVTDTIDMATDTENDPYLRLAVLKFITEHLEGKATAMTDKESPELPKLVICVEGSDVETIKNNITNAEGAEPKEDILVEISDEDGSNSEEYIV